MLHLDLALEYMEIVDKALVDEFPKISIMMLCHKLLDFIDGGDQYPVSLLRRVQKDVKTMEPEKVLVKSFEHEEMIKDLKNRKRCAEETIKVVDDTFKELKQFG